MTRVGKPTWGEEDFEKLLIELRNCGFGWLRPEGVRRQVEKMISEWKGPPLMPWELESVGKGPHVGNPKECVAASDRAERVRGVDDTALIIRAQAFLRRKQPVEAAECLLHLATARDDEQVIALKKAAAAALANHAVNFSNKYLGSLNQEMSRNGWDSGYNLGAAQKSARNLKFKTISWLKIASALDSPNSQICELIDSYFKLHVTSAYDRELCKR